MLERLDDRIADPAVYGNPAVYDEIFTSLRRNDPMRWTSPAGYRPFWTVTRYQDIVEIERQNDKFINEPRLNLNLIEDEERVRAGPGRGTTNPMRMLVNMDGAMHRAHRNITQSWFLPASLRKIESDVAALAKEFVDLLEARGGECDFAADVAVWFPLRVIMTILGMPREDDQKMLRLTKGILGAADREIANGLSAGETKRKAIEEFFAHFATPIAERRARPTGDLASVIANAEVDGRPISDVEAISYFVIIATAGHDTTSSSIAGGLHALIHNPSEMEKLRSSPQMLPSAVEEMLRWVSPVKHFFRTATDSYVLRGRSIAAGESLMMCYPSANRDEDVFEDPFSFKIDRAQNRHLAFGFGVHQCLGLHLARLEMKAFFTEFLSRVEHVELAGEPAWIEGSVVSGLKHLPIRYAMRR
ncbi:cytochrome P450 [Bradyrhizobium liaoningense]|uniref:cytochrome P450 n=1 Tax=Bradyrhizobium liaoningense TaxID=43992 RepID=UPI001BA6D2B7|nr:cytochrome P450 [Bradyrhizobium liaoningense]MBR0838918.1 cytochrome P450 [Bradyrhizobium liaoningense]